MVSHHLAKFSCHKDCGNVDIMISVCHVILQNHVIKSLYDFMGGTLMVSHHSVSFGGHGHCGSEDIMVFICHVILRDYVTKG